METKLQLTVLPPPSCLILGRREAESSFGQLLSKDTPTGTFLSHFFTLSELYCCHLSELIGFFITPALTIHFVAVISAVDEIVDTCCLL